MSVLIGVPCADTGRYSGFSESLSNLERPEGSVVRFATSPWRHVSRNHFAQMTLDKGFEWLLMVDDDQVFAPDLLQRLLMLRVPVVGALCLQKGEPFGPFCFSDSHEDGSLTSIDLQTQRPIEIEVEAVGTGVILIHNDVLRSVPPPWFEVTSESGEDIIFCRKVREQGIPIYCDLSSPVGHLTTTAVWPVWNGDRWRVGFVVSGEARLSRELTPPERLTA